MNASSVGIDTKHKIVNVARKLFARHGFEGTSIRNIARLSEVNLAAVNYHFKSKENLFWEVMTESFKLADEFCRASAEGATSMEELALNVFDRFQSERDLVRNSMKMMLTEDLEPTEDVELMCGKSIGPPGGEYFAKIIEKEIPYPLSEAGIFWGVKAMFGTIMHWATMCQTHGIKARIKDNLITPDQIREDVRHMIRSHMNYLKDHPEIFGRSKV